MACQIVTFWHFHFSFCFFPLPTINQDTNIRGIPFIPFFITIFSPPLPTSRRPATVNSRTKYEVSPQMTISPRCYVTMAMDGGFTISTVRTRLGSAGKLLNDGGAARCGASFVKMHARDTRTSVPYPIIAYRCLRKAPHFITIHGRVAGERSRLGRARFLIFVNAISERKSGFKTITRRATEKPLAAVALFSFISNRSPFLRAPRPRSLARSYALPTYKATLNVLR